MENQNKNEGFTLEQALADLGFGPLVELDIDLEKLDSVEPLDDIEILRKKVKRLEKENRNLVDKITSIESAAALALQQNFILREEIKMAFYELSRREERSIEKNTLPFEGERREEVIKNFVKPGDLNKFRKDKKVKTFSYAMGIEHSKWKKN